MKKFLEFGTPERTKYIKKLTPGETEEGFYDKVTLDQINNYLKGMNRLIPKKDMIAKLKKKWNLKKIEFNPMFTKILAIEHVELNELYGTVKISGKRGRLVSHSPGEIVFVGNKKQAEKNLKQVKKDGGDGYIMQGVTIKVGEKVKGVGEERDYKDEYKKFQSTKKAIKYRSELNQYNRKRGTYGNNDGKDASHKNGKIVGFEDESTNRGRREKSRLKVNETFKTFVQYLVEFDFPQIYCDMDGVLADFTTFTTKYLGTGFSDEHWQDLPEDLFYQLPPMSDAKKLWNYIKQFDPFVLTATPRDTRGPIAGRAAEDKSRWMKEKFGLDKEMMRPVMRKNKSNFAKDGRDGRPNLLIDDHKKNVEEFKRAGGIGIHHINAASTIRKLKKLGYP